MIIPQFVIAGWMEQYDSGQLAEQYPEVNLTKIVQLMSKDRPIVRDICFDGTTPTEQKIYLATAGAPCAGKSTILEQVMLSNNRYSNLVKVDPDRWGMLYMLYTYTAYMMGAAMTANAESYKAAQVRAYDVCRPASNILTLEIMNEAVDKGYSLVHGTTMTGAHVGSLMANLSEKGYEIDLIICMASDETRAQAAAHRSNVQGYYQSTPEDVREKGILLPQRMETYFLYADNLSFFWREDSTSNAVLVAKSMKGSNLEIIDEIGWSMLSSKHNADAESQDVEIKSFEELIALR